MADVEWAFQSFCLRNVKKTVDLKQGTVFVVFKYMLKMLKCSILTHGFPLVISLLSGAGRC